MTVPISTRKKDPKRKLVQTHLLSKAVLANLADLCTEKVCTKHRDIYIYIYSCKLHYKWDFSSKFFFVFSVGITPTVINLSVKTLSLSLSLSLYLSIYLSIHLSSSLSLYLSLCDLCLCLQLQRYLGQFHKVYNFEQQQCNSSSPAVRLASLLPVWRN